MKNLPFLIIIILFSQIADSQSIISLFRMLPADCTPELNAKQRNLLLKKRQYTIPGGDSEETAQYLIDEVDTTESKGFLAYEFSFTTGQNGFTMYQIRKFRKSDGTPLLLFSEYAGTLRAFDQQELRIFIILKDKLVESKEKLLPQEISIDEFFVKGTPDSVRSAIQSDISTSYDLNPEQKNSIAFRLFDQVSSEEHERYLLGDIMLFTWTGKSFTRKIIKK